MRIYCASKSKHYKKWIELRNQGYNIISSWIDVADPSTQVDFLKLWLNIIEEIKNCDLMLVYHEPDEKMKGALVEIGAALLHDCPIYLVDHSHIKEDDIGTWIGHPLVARFNTFEDAMKQINGKIFESGYEHALRREHPHESSSRYLEGYIKGIEMRDLGVKR